jgi:alkylated DNA repair dioxygenase AlkB
MEQHVLAVRPDSITMNQYLAQQAILAHIDDPKGGKEVTVLSLLTPARLVFRKHDRVFTVDLPPRSLVQMRDEIRYNWTHEIEPVADTRYSLVFRCSQDIQQ